MTQYTAQREAGKKLTRDIQGKFLPSYTEEWAKQEQEREAQLDARRFSASDVELAIKYGTDADMLFA
jgi:hypothetical protein